MRHSYSTVSGLVSHLRCLFDYFKSRMTGAGRISVMCTLAGFGILFMPAISFAQSSDIQTWRQGISDEPPSQTGCFEASYPSNQWQQVPCKQSEESTPFLMRSAQTGLTRSVGGTGNPTYTAVAQGGPISSVEGSFINVAGVGNIGSMANASSSTAYVNYFSLQINSNRFPVTDKSLCLKDTGGCEGVVQFVHSNNGSSGGHILIQYWILETTLCPTSWELSQRPGSATGCFIGKTSTTGVSTPALQPADLGKVVLSGQTANGNDIAIITINEKAYATIRPSIFKNFPQNWQEAEFNIFGQNSDLPVVTFTPGTALTARVKINNGTTNAPTCSNRGVTAESSTLNFNSPCCPYGGAEPSIAFSESTTAGQTMTCAMLGNNTITPFAGANGAIYPATTLSVPDKAVSTFTVMPNPNYQVISISGCGGTRNGNFFVTAPASGNCTVTASFMLETYVITASASTGGTISPSGFVQVSSGATKMFSVIPDSGYTLSSVGGTCGGSLVGDIYITKAITKACTVSASFTPQQTYVITASAGANGTISPSGYFTVNPGVTQAFTLTPNSGYSVASVGGTCGGTLSGNTYTTKPVTASCTVTPTFAPTYTVTASAGTGGAISPSGAVAAASGMTKTFTLTPNVSYAISSVGGTCGGTLSGNTYTTKAITANCTVTPTFAQTTTYTVTTSAGANGSISPSGAVSVTSGTSKAFTLTPSSGYAISSAGGTCGGTLNGKTYTTNAITGNCTVTAAFTPATYIVTANAGARGTISPSGRLSTSAGATRSFTFAPDTGYAVSAIETTCGGSQNGNTYSTARIDNDCSIAVSFAPVTTMRTITVTASNGGSVSPAGAVSVASGTTKAFTLTPSSGYAVSAVGGTCGGTLSGNTYTTKAVTANCTVVAAFVKP